MNQKILFVDDDPNLLAALKRGLRKQFEFDVALGPEQGLSILDENGPFAVVVADMRMPGMNGVQFLAEVKTRSPDTVRMMLTGNADLQTAITAVNEGNIFRFLTKPSSQEVLAVALNAGLTQYRLVTAEKELLEKTLMGSIKVLTEMLSMANPMAFSRSARIRNYVRHIGMMMKLPNWWQYEVAALLSQIGCVTLPPDMLDKFFARMPFSAEDAEMFANHPKVGQNLLVNIPRLGPIAKMIGSQQKSFHSYPPIIEMTEEERTVALGGQILRIALDFDQLIVSGKDHLEALRILRTRRDNYNPDLLGVLETLPVSRGGQSVKVIKAKELRISMIADQDIEALNGLLLVPKGQEITYPVLERLRNFAQRIGLVEPIRVIIPPSRGG